MVLLDPVPLDPVRITGRAFPESHAFYVVADKNDDPLGTIDTNWGTLPEISDGSWFSDRISETSFSISDPIMESGIGRLVVEKDFYDYRTNLILNDNFFPTLRLQIRWTQQSPTAELELSDPIMSYTPNGGGALNVDVVYSYGGVQPIPSNLQFGEERGGFHSIALVFEYSSEATRGSEASVERTVSLGSSLTVSDASIRFVRGIEFYSY